MSSKSEPKKASKLDQAAAEGSLADVRSLEIARRIESYRPRDIDLGLWDHTLAPFVLPALKASKPVGVSGMERTPGCSP